MGLNSPIDFQKKVDKIDDKSKLREQIKDMEAKLSIAQEEVQKAKDSENTIKRELGRLWKRLGY